MGESVPVVPIQVGAHRFYLSRKILKVSLAHIKLDFVLNGSFIFDYSGYGEFRGNLKRVRRNKYEFRKVTGYSLISRNISLSKIFISTKDDESWKWTPERELNSFEIQELGFNCERARMLLEETVNEEYCTYITSKYQNFEAILQNMADQFNHIDCGDSILMRCNGKFKMISVMDKYWSQRGW